MSALRRRITLALMLTLFFSADASAATNVAVFNFQMTTDTPDWRWLEKGLADRIATDFVQAPGLSVVARDEMQLLAQKMNWVPEMATTDAARMEEIRKALTIKQLLSGVYAVADGRIRITGQIVDVESRTELARKEVEGPVENVLELQRQLSAELLAWFTRQEPAKILETLPVWTRSLPAMRALYEGMDLYDQGRYAEAWLQFRQASGEDPAYVEAVYWVGKMYYFMNRYEHARRSLERFVYLDMAHPRLGDAMVEYVHTYESTPGVSADALLRMYEDFGRRFPNARIEEEGDWKRHRPAEAQNWFEFKSFELLGQVGRYKEVAQRTGPCLWEDYYITPARAPVSSSKPTVCRRNVLLHQALTGEAFGRDILVRREWAWCDRMLLTFDKDATPQVYTTEEPQHILGQAQRGLDKQSLFDPPSVEIPLVLAAPDGHVFESARFYPLADGTDAEMQVGVAPPEHDPSSLFRIGPPVSADLAAAREQGVFWKDLPRRCILRAYCRFVAKGPDSGPVVVRGVRVEPTFRRIARPGAIEVRCADTQCFRVHVDGVFARWFPGLIGPLEAGEHRIAFLPADQGPWPEVGRLTVPMSLNTAGLRIICNQSARVYLPTVDKETVLRASWETTVRVKAGEVTQVVGRLPYKEGSGWEDWKTASVLPEYPGYDVRLGERWDYPPAVQADEQAIRVIWSQRGDLWSSVCSDEETFSPPRKLDLPVSSGWCEYAPCLIRDEEGRFVLAFLSDRDARHRSLPYLSWSRDFVHWSAPVQIADESAPQNHALVQDSRGQLWWAKADLGKGIAVYSSRNGDQWKRVAQLQPKHKGAEVMSVDLLPSEGGGMEVYAAERNQEYDPTLRTANSTYQYHVVRHGLNGDGQGAESESVATLPPCAMQEIVCDVSATRDANGPALLVQLRPLFVLLRQGIYSRPLMVLFTPAEAGTWRRWAKLPSVAGGPFDFLYVPGRGYLIGWVGEAPRTASCSSYGPFVTWGPALAPLRQAFVDSTDKTRTNQEAVVSRAETQEVRLLSAAGETTHVERHERFPEDRFPQHRPSRQPVGSAGPSPIGQLKWLPIPPEQPLYTPHVFIKGAEHFQKPRPGDGTINRNAVIAKVEKGETTVALAFDSTEPDAPHFDVLRIDTTGQANFNGSRAAPRTSIQHIQAEQKYIYYFEDYNVPLPRMGPGALAWVHVNYKTTGPEPAMSYWAGTSAEGRCRFGDKVHWVRFIDTNSTLRVTDEPRVVSVGGEDCIEGDYVCVYTHGGNAVRASQGYYSQPIQVDGQWWNLRVADDGQHVTAEPYEGPLARLRLSHPFWQLVLRGEDSVINVSGGEESVTVPVGRYTVHQYYEYVSLEPNSESPQLEMSTRVRGFDDGGTLSLKAGAETVFPIGTPLHVTLDVSQKEGSLFFDVDLRDCQGKAVILERLYEWSRDKDGGAVQIVLTRQSDQLALKLERSWIDMDKRGWKIPYGLKGTFTASIGFPSDTFPVECEPVTFTIE